jgi:beta-glucosidase
VPEQARAGEQVELSVEVENVGSMAADEVVQLYVSPIRPPAPEGSGGQGVRTTLAGFRRLSLGPGERMRVAFVLDDKVLAQTDSRRFTISVGGKQPGFRGLADAPTTAVATAALEVIR